MPDIVIVQNLYKRYGDVQAVSGVSFSVAKGEIFGLIGPNGAGKTTTLECLLGLRTADAGSIQIGGLDARTHASAVKRKIGAALQTTALQDKITPREALTLFAALYGVASNPKPLLTRFALDDKADAPFDSLSGGQRQRLALALAFVNHPELIVLDEPTAGLDPQARHDLHGAILQMKHDGYTVLVTTHYLEEAEALCDRIAIIDRGRVIATGSPRELTAGTRGAPMVSITTESPIDPAWLDAVPGIEELTVDGRTARFRAASSGPALEAVLRILNARGVTISDVSRHTASLEDVFLQLTADSGSETRA